MFTRTQMRHSRRLRSVDQALGPFHALVGPNASGKTTFLDVFPRLGDVMRPRGHVAEAVRPRGADPSKPPWMGQGSSSRLAVEAAIPKGAIERPRAEANQPGSASLHQGIAQEIGLERCVDPSSLRLKEALRAWSRDDRVS